jgi:uncharacterized protein (DUF4415 family)
MKKTNYTKEELLELKSKSARLDKLAAINDEDIIFDEDSPDVARLYEEGRLRKVGRPRKPERKEPISIRLDTETLKALRDTGGGWQTRLSRQISAWVQKGRMVTQENDVETDFPRL